MPRFFFHVHDGASYRDDEGTELPHWQAAQQEAMLVAGGMIVDKARKAKLNEDWSMTVTDATGLMLFQLDFQIAVSPEVAKRDGALQIGRPCST